jgi:hypothetical protein
MNRLWPILSIFALCAVAFCLMGCASQPLQHDVIPAGYEGQFYRAEAQAVEWYQDRYGVAPNVPAIRLVVEAQPLNGMGGWTPNAHTVHIWVGQLRDMGHEIRHALCLYNGKGGSEEAIR